MPALRSALARLDHAAFLTAAVLGAALAASASAAPDSTKTRPSSDEPWDVNVPHAPSDTLRFETDRGTWMTVDVSPDGRALLFDMLGDIYTLPIAGGRAKRLTSGMAYDMQARWSPDGKRIAFATDRGGTENVWVMEADGSRPRPVSREADHTTNSSAWSPDGEWIVTRRRLTDKSSLGTVELWMYSMLGGKGVQITKKEEFGDANEPVFSREGRYVYFTGRPQRFGYDRNVHSGIWQIRQYDRVTGKTATLTDPAGGAGRPAPSPDGKSLSFIRRIREKTVLMVHDLATGRERMLWDGLSNDNQEGFAWTGMVDMFDAGPIIYADGGFFRVDALSGRAARIPFTASVEQIVTHAIRFRQHLGGDRVQVRQIAWPSRSPDRKSIVFAALGRIWRYDAAAREARALTPSKLRASSPAWSPDGRWIAYVTWDDSTGGYVWKMPAGGGKPVRITSAPSEYLNPSWSRDGSKLCYLRGSGGPMREGRDLNDELWLELQWISSAGGEPHAVVKLESVGDAPGH